MSVATVSPPRELEALLGDATDPANPYGFAAAVARDEAAAFPAELARAAGPALRLCYLPTTAGGTMAAADETLTLVRTAARRDLTVMPATMFSITAATCVLLAGDAARWQRVRDLLARGGAIGFALTEAEHGSDLTANTCRLEPDPAGGYRLWGEKWLVGLGDRADALLVCARTGERGPGAFTLVLLEGSAVAAARTAPLPVSGMRGIGFTGFSFAGTPVPAGAVVGRVGQGLELAMRAMQHVRLTSTAASLAAADNALRWALDHAVRHRVGGRAVADLVYPRRRLATAATALMAAEAATVGAARALHLAPESLALWSSVVKHVAVDAAATVFDICAEVLGTAGVLRTGPAAAFDTFRRDNAVVRHIDTGPVANLRLVAAGLTQLALRGPGPDRGAGALFRLGEPLPPARLDGLVLAGRHDPVTAALPEVAARADAELARSGEGLAGAARADLRRLTAALTAQIDRVRDQRATATTDAPDPLAEAERFCFLHAAASFAHLWWANRDQPLWADEPGTASWLAAALPALLTRAGTGRWELPEAPAAAVSRSLRRLHAGNRLLSATALPLHPAHRADETGEERAL